MNSLQAQKTITAEWYSLVDDAVMQCGYKVDDLLKQYLMITLDHYSTDCQLSSVIIAIDFLKGLGTFGRLGYIQLRQVGDRCLLLAGLFPERAHRKNITEKYYINIGRQAYDILAHIPIRTTYDSELYHRLSDEFQMLIDVLHAMRNLKSMVIH